MHNVVCINRCVPPFVVNIVSVAVNEELNCFWNSGRRSCLDRPPDLMNLLPVERPWMNLRRIESSSASSCLIDASSGLANAWGDWGDLSIGGMRNR